MLDLVDQRRAATAVVDLLAAEVGDQRGERTETGATLTQFEAHHPAQNKLQCAALARVAEEVAGKTTIYRPGLRRVQSAPCVLPTQAAEC